MSDQRSYPIGYVHSLKGQDYEVISVEPYQRISDGVWTELYVLQSHCANADCDDLFVIRCGPSAIDLFRPLNRRCEPHHNPMRRVKRRSRAKRKAAKP